MMVERPGLAEWPASRAGRVLLSALSDDFDPDDPEVWRDIRGLWDEVAAQDGAVLVAAVLITLEGLFGRDPDVRAITRRLRAIQNRLSDGRGLPMRGFEEQIRVLLGERWLYQFIDQEAMLAAGVGQLGVWRGLIVDYLHESGTDVRELVAMAEERAAAGSEAAQMGAVFHELVAAMRSDPDVQPAELGAVGRRLREVIWEEQGTL